MRKLLFIILLALGYSQIDLELFMEPEIYVLGQDSIFYLQARTVDSNGIAIQDVPVFFENLTPDYGQFYSNISYTDSTGRAYNTLHNININDSEFLSDTVKVMASINLIDTTISVIKSSVIMHPLYYNLYELENLTASFANSQNPTYIYNTETTYIDTIRAAVYNESGNPISNVPIEFELADNDFGFLSSSIGYTIDTLNNYAEVLFFIEPEEISTIPFDGKEVNISISIGDSSLYSLLNTVFDDSLLNTTLNKVYQVYCFSEFDECGICNGPGDIYECGCNDEQTHCRDLDGDGFGTSEFTFTTCDVEGDIWVLNCEDLDDNIYCESNETDCAGILCGDTIVDCSGICGGNSELDNCDICDYDTSNDCVQDCAGVWGGTAMIDCFGVCNGGAVIDECNVCGGLGAIYECGCADIPAGDCDCEGNVIQDFYADWDGDGYGNCDLAYSYCPSDAEDWMSSECGDCNNSDASVIFNDCSGVCGGNLELDCAGECNGDAVLDECGVCNGDGIAVGACDCDGNVDDACGVCGGDGVDADLDGVCDDVDDCVGEYDECGVCNGDGIADGACDCDGNVEDCAGVCGGSAIVEECESSFVITSDYHELPSIDLEGNDIFSTTITATLIDSNENPIHNSLVAWEALQEDSSGQLTLPIGSIDPYTFTNENGVTATTFSMGNDQGLAYIIATAPELSLSDTTFISLSPCPPNFTINYLGQECFPNEFTYIPSNVQAGYIIESVEIDGVSISNEDWVGVFNGNTCVGATQWNTNNCLNGICSISANGNDFSGNFFNNYLLPGDIPNFKIYDSSENIYYDAFASENYPFYNQNIYFIDTLESISNSDIIGCMDSLACNYNPQATSEGIGGSLCWYANQGCDCSDGENAISDCNNECNGNASYDGCGVCSGGNTNIQPNSTCGLIENGCDLPLNTIGFVPKVGDELYGQVIYNIDPENIVGIGGFQFDINNAEMIFSEEFNPYLPFYGGDATLGGLSMYANSTTILGLSLIGDVIQASNNQLCGELINIAYENNFSSNSDEVFFTNIAFSDADGNPLISVEFQDTCMNEQYDCNGICGGDAYIDLCENCVEGLTGYNDCADGYIDCYGNIGIDADTDVVLDCFGVCGGDAVVDACGVCGGDGASCSLGDLNSDGNIDIVDIVNLVNAVLAWTYNPLGDMNEDGTNDIVDVVLLVNLVLYGPPVINN